MKLNLLILILIFFGIHYTMAQANKIIIQGKISEKVRSSYSDDIWYYDNYNFFAPTSNDVYPLRVNKGTFKIEVKNNNMYGYFLCRAAYVPSIQLDLFLVQEGDSIYMDIYDDQKVSFYGKGSEKLNYQHYLATLRDNLIPFTHQDSINYGNLDRLQMYARKNEAALNTCLDSLQKLQKYCDSFTNEILHINTVAAFNYNYLVYITGIFPFVEEKEKSQIMNELQIMLSYQQMNPITDKKLLNNVITYKQLLYYTQLYYSRLLQNGHVVNAAKLSHTFNAFEKNYSGLVRDNLISYLLLHQTKDSESLKLAEKSLSFVEDIECHRILTEIVNAKKNGQPAYPFVFATPDKKEVKLNDFQGKILIIDTWYYGCTNCAILASVLAPVVKKYSNSQKVTFLSVNIDSKREAFIKGIKSGLYGEKGVIHVWTNGNGEFDPFIKFYQYSGYPNVLIIDKNGNVISSNPFQKGEEAAKKIQEIIDSNL